MVFCNKWNYKEVFVKNIVANAFKYILENNNYDKEISLTELNFLLEETLEDHLVLHTLPSCYLVRFK